MMYAFSDTKAWQTELAIISPLTLLTTQDRKEKRLEIASHYTSAP